MADFEDEVKRVIDIYLKNGAFHTRKVTDTPTDDLMVVNRKYVNLYGTTSQRPSIASKAQQYFDTTINRPIFFNPNSSVWTDAAGSIR